MQDDAPRTAAAGATWLWLIVALAFVFFSWWAYTFASVAFRPCESNFEGGCGYAKALDALLSVICALLSSGCAVALAAIARDRLAPRGLVWLVGSLALPGTVYTVYCLYLLLGELGYLPTS